jgi:hypothetical protein
MVLRISFAVLMRLLGRTSVGSKGVLGMRESVSFGTSNNIVERAPGYQTRGQSRLEAVSGDASLWGSWPAGFRNKYQKGLILAQNERWRRGLGMQVEREPARGTAANGVGTRR